MKIFLSLFCLHCLAIAEGVAQNLLLPDEAAIPLRTIVQLQPTKQPPTVNHLSALAEKIQPLSQHPTILLLQYADSSSWLQDAIALQQQPTIAALQYDYPVHFRNQPNDPSYPQQTNLARIGLPQVWAENTGGFTANGHQIVIAILDAGFDVSHEDLQGQLWINPAEIPDDGIDNDNNGYIDDRHGWSYTNDSPNYRVQQHGTQVLGMLAAAGNNGIGVTGVGWNNQAMLFSIAEVSDILAAYSYILAQRQKWQQSNGLEGALVVVTNASFGLEGRRCLEFPIWRDMYDRLGEQGILTAASTANRSWNVDDFGDMPTTCPSEFLLSVTNLSDDDRLATSAAWGPISIDLAAPGQGSYTTNINNSYSAFSRTSAAAPYVTGAIALLYSANCERLNYLLDNDPAGAARLIRRSLLQSVQVNESFRDLTSTEGQLDVWAAWQQLLANCSDSNSNQLQITAIYPNPSQGAYFNLEFSDPSLGPYQLELFDSSGRLQRQYILPVGSAFPLSNRLAVDGLAAGLYLLRLRSERQVATAKLLLRP